ncbi:MAG: calcium-binding protein [Oleispira sp.]
MNFKSQILIALTLLFSINTQALDTLCATVKIEIEQELTLERQAFEASMKITNSLDTFALENIAVDLVFKDENDAPVLVSSDPNASSAAFYVRLDDSRGVAGLTDLGLGRIANGTVAAASTAEMKWLIIPVPGAAKDSPSGKLYFIGAKLRYEYGGKAEQVVVADDTIVVKPLPKLTLDYFLTQNVFGDDAFTEIVEPIEPYTLGIRIANNGTGIAKSVKLDSAQPKIVENELGLAIGFQITGSYVNEQPAAPSLLLNFGDIPSKGRTMGRWIMETTLSGEFTEFKATVSHAAELGGELTSLIEGAHTHLLVNNVQVDLPGRDSVADFLAHKPGEEALYVYESEPLDIVNNVCEDCSPVAKLNASLSAAQALPEGTLHSLLPAENEFAFGFIKITDPYAGRMALDRAVRKDGRVLNSRNAWLGRERSSDKINFDHFIYLFDHAIQTDGYQLFFTESQQVPQAPVIQFIPNKVTYEGGQVGFLLRASDPNGTLPDVRIESMPLGAAFEYDPTHANYGKGIFSWFPQVGQKGSYSVRFVATDGELSSELTVVIVVNSADDTDGDGLPDDWEREHFGDLSQDGNGDLDGDGYSNLEEWQKGWNPLEAAKVPNVPTILLPIFDGEVESLLPELEIVNSQHSADIDVTYSYEMFADSAMTERVWQKQGIVEGFENTVVTLLADDLATELRDNHLYYWRVRGVSSEGSSEWAVSQLFTNTVNDAPDQAWVSSPEDHSIVSAAQPDLVVNSVVDIDRDQVSYKFTLFNEGSDEPLYRVGDLAPGEGLTTSWKIPQALQENQSYLWQVKVTDEHGLSSSSEVYQFLFSSQNDAPTAPAIIGPLEEVASLTPVIQWSSAEDPEGADVVYDLQWSDRADFSILLDETLGLMSSVDDMQSYQLPLQTDNQSLYWRVRSNDGELVSHWSQTQVFVNSANDAPSAPTLANPADNSVVEVLMPLLLVNPPVDIDNDQVSYEFELYQDAGLSQLITSRTSVESQWRIDTALPDNQYVFWRARAIDEHGSESYWMPPARFFVNNEGIDDAPIMQFALPATDIELIDGEVLIQWTDSDPDSSAKITLWYENDLGEFASIVENIEEDADGQADQYVWHVSDLAVGEYTIKGAIEDDSNRVDVSAVGRITILPNEGHVLAQRLDDVSLREADDSSTRISIVLDRAPITGTDVTIPLSISDASELKLLSVMQGGEAKTTNYLYFNADNWNQPYELLLTAQDDCDIDGTQQADVVLGKVSSLDTGFSDIDPVDITLAVDDNEVVGQNLFVCDWEIIDQKIVGDDVVGQYRIRIKNTGDTVAMVEARLQQSEKYQIVDSAVVHFHEVSSGRLTASTDILTLRYPANKPINARNLTWQIDVKQANKNQLPAGWKNENIGLVWRSGRVSVSGSQYEVTGSGADIWLLADSFHYVYRSLSGDGEIVTQVNGLSNTHEWAKAGVMIRESDWTGSKHAFMLMTPKEKIDFQYRSTTSWSSYSHGAQSASFGTWLKLVRKGSTFSSYRSVDGMSWNLIAEQNISMSQDVLIGLAVTSHTWLKDTKASFNKTMVEQY